MVQVRGGGGLMLHDTLSSKNVTLHLCVPVLYHSGSVSLSYFVGKRAYICLMDIIRSLEWMIGSAAERVIQCL